MWPVFYGDKYMSFKRFIYRTFHREEFKNLLKQDYDTWVENYLNNFYYCGEIQEINQEIRRLNEHLIANNFVRLALLNEYNTDKTLKENQEDQLAKQFEELEKKATEKEQDKFKNEVCKMERNCRYKMHQNTITTACSITKKECPVKKTAPFNRNTDGKLYDDWERDQMDWRNCKFCMFYCVTAYHLPGQCMKYNEDVMLSRPCCWAEQKKTGVPPDAGWKLNHPRAEMKTIESHKDTGEHSMIQEKVFVQDEEDSEEQMTFQFHLDGFDRKGNIPITFKIDNPFC
jgi:hypothetical protein